MKKIRDYIMILAVCLFAGAVWVSGSEAAAADGEIQSYYLDAVPETESAVNDFAGVYTPEQIEGFEKELAKMRQDYDCNVVAFIIDNEEYASSELLAPERVSEKYLDLDTPKSTVVLWLNVASGNRSLYLLGYGSAQHKITDREADEITNGLKQYVVLAQENPEGGLLPYQVMMEEFIKCSDEEMRRPYFFLTWWFHLILGVVLGVVVILVLLKNAGGRMTTDGATYLNQNFSQLKGRRDIYTHTTYVRTRKSSSSGGGGGGGHSHSSGGGRF